MRKRWSSILYVVIFAIFIAGIGLLSVINLVNFYVNDEVDYNEWSADLGNKFETDVATTFFGKVQFVNINGLFRKLLGQREMNKVVKLNNGYLLTTVDYVDDDTLQSYANNISKFDKYLKSKDIDLLFAMTPYTSGKYDTELPTGIIDSGNDNADRLMRKIEASNIDTIDFRDLMFEEGIDHYSMMYKTDHHWNTRAGFYAYQKLEEYIVRNTGCIIDDRYSDLNNYTIKTYKNWHLGSRGQRTGRYFSGVDDFELIIPNFTTSIRGDNGIEGNMQDIVYNLKPLDKRTYTSRYTYDKVLQGSLGHFQNLESKNNVKILIISDSYGKAVCPFLMMNFSEIMYVYNQDVSDITPQYIDEYNPDVVICLYYLQSAMLDSTFSFQSFE